MKSGTPKPDTTDLKTELNQFTGTEHYYKFSVLFPTLVLTDGAKYLAEKAQCYWLMDIIGSVQYNLKNEAFQVVNLKVEDTKGIVTVDDGNDNILYTQKTSYTDFPMGEIKLYVCDGDGNKVIMLPSEY